jgi:GTP-binding protein
MYMTQEGVHPPSFVVFGRGSSRVHFGYRRALENFLRRRLGLSHTPLVLRFRARAG